MLNNPNTRFGLVNLAGSVILLLLTFGIQTQWSRIVQVSNLLLLFPIFSLIIASYTLIRLTFEGQNKPLSSLLILLFLQLVLNLIGLSLPYALVKLTLGAGLALFLPLPGYVLFFLFLLQCLGNARLKGLFGVLVGILWVFMSEYAFGANIAGYLPITMFNIFGLFLGLLLLFWHYLLCALFAWSVAG